MRECAFRLAVILAALGASTVASAQDLRGSPPLPTLPQVYATSEHRILVSEVAGGARESMESRFFAKRGHVRHRARRAIAHRA